MVNNLMVRAKKPPPSTIGYRIKLVTMSAISAITELKWKCHSDSSSACYFCYLGGKLVDFYDGGDHVHIWGLKFRKDEHIWGLRFWGPKSNYLESWIRSQSDTLKEQIIMWFWDGLNFWERYNFVSENLVNIFGVFEKFGQHIWGSEKMAWHDHSRHKSQWVTPRALTSM